MAFTVNYSFTIFFDAINLAGDHRTAANIRKDAVVALLEKKFTITEAFTTGSIPRFTALDGYADLDVMIVLHYGQHIKDKTPTQVLHSVREALADRRPGVRRNGQAVTIKYMTWPNVDIVPVSRVVDDNGNVVHYNVPDSNTDKWIISNPQTHSKEMSDAASHIGEDFRKVVKMLKHWNRIHGKYLSSYHIEVMALRVFYYQFTDMQLAIHTFFKEGRLFLNSYMVHNGSVVDDYLSVADRQEIKNRFDTALRISRDAWYAKYRFDDDETAIKGWRLLFGEEFPKYGK